MKVKELIAKLQEYDGELEVLVDGYEGGCKYPSSIEEIEIKRDYFKNDSYCGKHGEVSESDKEDSSGCNDIFIDFLERGGVVSKAIIIRR